MRKQAKFIGIRAREDNATTGLTKGKLYTVDTSWAPVRNEDTGALESETGIWAGGTFIDDCGREGWAHIKPGSSNYHNVAMVFEFHL